MYLRLLRKVTQLDGLCTSTAVGVVTCCLDIGFRHMFFALGWCGWCIVRSADIIFTDHTGGRPDWWLLFGREGTISLVACLRGAIVGGGSVLIGIHVHLIS